jgi:hypothetical protein
MLTSRAESASTDPVHIDDLLLRMRHLVDSTEPAIVFSTLVRMCVPMFCDVATVDIVDGGRVRYRVRHPQHPGPQAAGLPADHELVTPFESHLPGWPSYSGQLRSGWFARAATTQDESRASAVVDYAIHLIDRERAADPVRSPRGFPTARTQPGSNYR